MRTIKTITAKKDIVPLCKRFENWSRPYQIIWISDSISLLSKKKPHFFVRNGVLTSGPNHILTLCWVKGLKDLKDLNVWPLF